MEQLVPPNCPHNSEKELLVIAFIRAVRRTEESQRAFGVQAIHSGSGSFLWQIPAGDHRMVWESIACTFSDF